MRLQLAQSNKTDGSNNFSLSSEFYIENLHNILMYFTHSNV